MTDQAFWGPVNDFATAAECRSSLERYVVYELLIRGEVFLHIDKDSFPAFLNPEAVTVVREPDSLAVAYEMTYTERTRTEAALCGVSLIEKLSCDEVLHLAFLERPFDLRGTPVISPPDHEGRTSLGVLDPSRNDDTGKNQRRALMAEMQRKLSTLRDHLASCR